MTATEGAVLEIDLAAIAANWRSLVARHPSGPVAGVVKADAYGLGATRVAPALLAAGCRHFFVAHLNEALALRPLLPGAMIAVLNGPLPGTEPAYLTHDITPVLGTRDAIARWSQPDLAAHPAIVHIDTGMNRLGLDAHDIAALRANPTPLSRLTPRYVMTHLVSSEVPDDPDNTRQAEAFAAARTLFPHVPHSTANSSALFLGPRFASDLARPGAALYGINPTPGLRNPMQPAIRLRAQVLQVRQIAQGDSVGYNATWRAARPSRIATACVGYADGWPRSLSSTGHAIFDARAVPLVGRVSMDLTTYDVTDFPSIAPGAWLDLIGPGIPVDTVAAAAETNGYEILTRLGARYARTWRA